MIVLVNTQLLMSASAKKNFLTSLIDELLTSDRNAMSSDQSSVCVRGRLASPSTIAAENLNVVGGHMNLELAQHKI